MYESIEINYEVKNLTQTSCSVVEESTNFSNQNCINDVQIQRFILQSEDLLKESLEMVLIESTGGLKTDVDERNLSEERDDIDSYERNHHIKVKEVPFKSSPETLRLVVESGFLNYREIGRLLLLVSKSIASCGFLYDEVWKSLLVNRFGSEIAYQMMTCLQCGPQQCFRHLIKTEPVKPIMTSFTPRDYKIVINIYNDDGKRIFFQVLQGDRFPQFFDDGFVVIKGADGLKTPLYTRYSGLFKTKATVHIVRIPDQRSICIIDDRKGLNEYSLERRYFIFTTSTAPSTALSLAHESTEKLLNNSMDFITHGIYFNLRMKVRKTTSQDICPDNKNIAIYGNLILEAVCHPTDVLFKDGKNTRNTKTHLTFLHILEKLYGWEN